MGGTIEVFVLGDRAPEGWIRGDDIPEGPEQFVLVVSDASAPVRDSDGRATIADEDPPQPLLTTTAFTSVADNLVSGDTNGRPDLFVRGPFT
jgi:hypothetical protein